MTITDVVQLTVFPPSENPAKEITVWFVEILSYQSLLRTVSHKNALSPILLESSSIFREGGHFARGNAGHVALNFTRHTHC